MILSISKLRNRKTKIEIDLTGPHGNAYFLMAQGISLCDQLGKDFEPIRKRMMEGDYENLLKVFDAEFGEYVNLYR